MFITVEREREGIVPWGHQLCGYLATASSSTTSYWCNACHGQGRHIAMAVCTSLSISELESLLQSHTHTEKEEAQREAIGTGIRM
jgi:hypothetical protein